MDFANKKVTEDTMCSKHDIKRLLEPIGQSFKDKKEAILSVMSFAGPGAVFNPVQIQKILFLLDERAKEKSKGTLFNFTRNKYGPFDEGLYSILDELHAADCVEILPGWSSKILVLKPKGFKIAKKCSSLSGVSKKGLKNLVEWILKHKFIELVTAIYGAYPNKVRKRVIAKSNAEAD